MNEVIERAIERQREKERADERPKRGVPITPEQAARIIAFLNKRDAEEIRNDLYRQQRRLERAVAGGQEIATKSSPVTPSINPGFSYDSK